MNIRQELDHLFGQDPAMALENMSFHQDQPPRLRLGPYILSLARIQNGISHWAVPGGMVLTYGECGHLARRRGWSKPELVSAKESA